MLTCGAAWLLVLMVVSTWQREGKLLVGGEDQRVAIVAER